jgi:hypothetical protein
MASTNEDAVALAGVPFEDGRVLVVRHLPDRGTVEIGWWRQAEGALVQTAPVLELAAEAVEVEAFRRLCEQVAVAGWEKVSEGGEIALAGPFADGVRLAALRASDGVTFVRRPEGDALVAVSKAALGKLTAELLPAAMQKLEKLGFGLVQQEEPVPPGPTGSVRS